MNDYNYNGRPAPGGQNGAYGNGWNYTTQYTATPPPAPTPPQKPKKGRAGRAFAAIALVLACGVSGFGGSYLANTVFAPASSEQTVFYKSAETDDATAAPVGSAEDLSVSGIATKALDSVVSITTENLVSDPFMGGQIVSGAGSGVVLSADGYIITNHHVVEGARSTKVTLQDGREFDAVVVGSDARSDIAVLKISADGLTPAVLGDSGSLAVGEFCMAIGNPMGTLGGTVTDGIISAVDRELTIDNNTMNLLQMSAAVSPGNSGGGLFNAKGELIGIVNAKSGSQNTEGLGFAIPVNQAVEIAEQLISGGQVSGRPALGITAQGVTTQQEATQLGVAAPGVYIQSVNPGGAAEKAGLRQGDRIVAVGDAQVETLAGLSKAIEAHSVGDTVTVTLERDGQALRVELVLEELAT